MLKVHDKPANAEEQDEDSTLDELAREGARWMLMKALAVEITQYVEEHGAERDEHGRRLVVRNGQAQARKVTYGAGTLEVRAPRVNDKRVDAAGQRERFTSRIPAPPTCVGLPRSPRCCRFCICVDCRVLPPSTVATPPLSRSNQTA